MVRRFFDGKTKGERGALSDRAAVYVRADSTSSADRSGAGLLPGSVIADRPYNDHCDLYSGRAGRRVFDGKDDEAAQICLGNPCGTWLFCMPAYYFPRLKSWCDRGCHTVIDHVCAGYGILHDRGNDKLTKKCFAYRNSCGII